MTVFNDKLHGNILGMHVSHFPLNAQVAHNRGRKDDGQVLGRHEVLRLALGDTLQVEHEELEAVAVALRHHVKRLA